LRKTDRGERKRDGVRIMKRKSEKKKMYVKRDGRKTEKERYI
jgi:hypothetical protein